MKRAALILAAVLVAGCEVPPPPDTRPSILLAELATPWPTEANLPRLAKAAAQCDQQDWAGCYLIRNRQAQVSRSVSACWDDESAMCIALREHVSQVANPAKYFPVDSQVLLPDTPFYWRLDNPYLDQLSEKHSFRKEVMWAWYRRIHLPLWLTILGITIALWLQEPVTARLNELNWHREVLRRLRREPPIKVIKFPKSSAQPEAKPAHESTPRLKGSFETREELRTSIRSPEERPISSNESVAAQPPHAPIKSPGVVPDSVPVTKAANALTSDPKAHETSPVTEPAKEPATVQAPAPKPKEEDPDVKALAALFSGRQK